MTIKTLSSSSVNANSKPEYPYGLTVSFRPNVGTADPSMAIQSFASGSVVSQRLVSDAYGVTFASGTLSAVSSSAKTATITITSAESFDASKIFAGMFVKCVDGIANGAALNTFSAASSASGVGSNGDYLQVVNTTGSTSTSLVINVKWDLTASTPPSAGTTGALGTITLSSVVEKWGPSLLLSSKATTGTSAPSLIDLGWITSGFLTTGSASNSYFSFWARNAGQITERLRVTNAGLSVIGSATGGVAPRSFIPAASFVPDTSTGPALALVNGIYVQQFTATTQVCYAYLPAPINWTGTSIKVAIYGTDATSTSWSIDIIGGSPSTVFTTPLASVANVASKGSSTDGYTESAFSSFVANSGYALPLPGVGIMFRIKAAGVTASNIAVLHGLSILFL